MSISKTQQAWLESLGVAILLGAVTALVPYINAGTPVNWSLVLAAGLSSGALALQAALRGLAQPQQGPLAAGVVAQGITQPLVVPVAPEPPK